MIFGSHATQAHAASTQVKIATFNAKLMPWPLKDSLSYAHLGRPAVDYDTRLSTMAGVASPDFDWSGEHPFDGGFDIIGYQEVWRVPFFDQHFSSLRKRLVAHGFKRGNIVRGSGPQSEEGYNHGLIIASRYTVLETAELHFGNGTGWDLLAQKGVLFARIDVNGTEIAVFNTHLQSAAGNAADNSGIRADHLSKLRAFIKQHANRSGAVVVMGDFNIRRVRPPKCKSAKNRKREYCQWFSNRAEYGDWSGFFDNGPSDTKRLDYILTGHPSRAKVIKGNYSKRICIVPGPPIRAVKCDKKNRHGAVTDHPLVFGEYKIFSGTAPPAVQAKP